MSQHVRPQPRTRRFARFAVAFVVCTALCAAPVLADTVEAAQAVPDRAPQGALPATFATGGSGRFKDSIQWLQWADYDTQFKGVDKPNVPVLDYGEGPKDFVNYRDLGDAGSLVTTCTLSNLTHLGHALDVSTAQAKGPLVATIPGAWAGDALDNLYNVGGPGSWSDGSEVWHSGLTYPKDYVNKNQMVIGLANGYAYNGSNAWDGKPWNESTDHRPTGYTARVSVDYSCKAEIHGNDGTITNVPIQGLVFADAEASSRRFGIVNWATDEWADEWVEATVKTTAGNKPVRWRVLDTLRSETCISKYTGKQVTTDGILSNASRTLRLMPSDEECVYQSGGSYSRPNGHGGPDAVMFMEGATSATVTLQGSGYSAVALGLVVATDFGDAPESYGVASSLFQPSWHGGEVRATTDLFKVSPQAEMYMEKGSPRLGESIDAEPEQLFSADALGDDNNGGTNDEDGFVVPAEGIRTRPGATHTENVKCEGFGKVAGWIDWNHNGVFDDAEKSDENACTASGEVTLSWTVPSDVVRSVEGEDGTGTATYMRLRITNDNNGDGQRPIGGTATGEVEDYRVDVRVPTLQLVKKVDDKYASGEVSGLATDQWTLTGGANGYTVSGQGTTGAPGVVLPGYNDIAETTSNPGGIAYESGQWTCEEAPGTLGENYTSSIPGTTTNGRAQVLINNTDRVLCTITNTGTPGSISWKKVDVDGVTPLGGTSWNLIGPDVHGNPKVKDCTASPCSTLPYSDQDPAVGSFKLEGLKWGTYTIREASAPAGYELSTESFTFPKITPTTLNVSLDRVIVNKRKSGSVTWKKVDASDTSKLLSGSEWTISGGALLSPVTIADCEAASANQCPKAPDATYYDTDPAAGSFAVKGLPWSANLYTLMEKKAPAGYRLDKTQRTFKISQDSLDFVFDPIPNEKQRIPGLPLTGGFGADGYVIGGIIAGLGALGAGAAIKRYKKRKA
ncbi:CshA/CshB family fibrillar adhesin-related protein [Schaalia cardiffensis]|uniref:CshA/CshB family fibrillar adhesin-related protein n=1 Tax=Schaalia cardiffensis TaxID=181487 RepID=UPI0023F1F1F6|nr:CshA/CshB family fibrillar adhesin-related protein [Schaalia cardiffensis]